MRLRHLSIFALLFFLASCGSFSSGDGANSYPDDVPTHLPPTIASVDPTSGPVGTVITILGFGFSMAAPNNTVIIGDSAISADAYDLLATPSPTEIESLTATVPDNTPEGVNSVAVIVGANTSNADITFTVTP